jgi:Type I phosphodiesterase / nucleotide pyrophosphatase
MQTMGADPPGKDHPGKDHPGTDDRIDELRQRLRSLGYLDAGVDRFVLGPARATRRPAAIALLASLRIGALAALLLGPTAAIGLGARIPGLLTGPRDALVVAVYLGVFFGVAVAVTAFLASLLVSFIARRAGTAVASRSRMLSLAAGTAVAVICLTYLTLWWQTVIAGLGWSAPLWTTFALAIAAATSVLLGHAATVLASAVIVAGTERASDPRVSTASSWWLVAASLAVAFGGAALLVAVSAGRSRPPQLPPALTVVSSGVRVRVIAIDGFDPHIFEELSSGGRLPTLTSAFAGARARLADQGGEQSISHVASDPARVWTTIATGQPPHIHGVEGLETRRVAGIQGSVPAGERSPVVGALRGASDLLRLTRPAIASGNERRAKTFWEVAAAAGLRTVVVNWWATWPAHADAGIVLSDRATLRLERGGHLDAEIAPEALYKQLQPRWPDIRARAETMAGDALRGSSAEGDVAALVRRSAELDAIQLVLLSDVAAADTDLSAVYLPGLDIAQHTLLGPQQALTSASTLAARLEALKDYYVALDRLLAPALIPTTGELVFVVTTPGRVTSPSSAQLVARGNVVAQSASIAGAFTNVAPTILYALGLPIGRDLSGGPLLALFTDPFTSRYPVRFVTTYGPPVAQPALREGKPLDQEMIDRLRSLGYVR